MLLGPWAPDPARDGLREARVAIRAWCEPEIFAPECEPICAQSDPDFFERLETIRDEGWTQHRESAHAARMEIAQDLIGVGFDPGCVPKSGLEGGRRVGGFEPEFFDECIRRRKTLRAITAREACAGIRTAVRTR
jgi:hypothetical protein